VIELDPRSASAYAALGIVEHQRGNMQESIARYHEVRRRAARPLCPSRERLD